MCGDNAKFRCHRDPAAGWCRAAVAATGWFARSEPLGPRSWRSAGDSSDPKKRCPGLADELVAPDHVYDVAVKWATRFVDSPAALAGAKALIDANLDVVAQERCYGEVFVAGAPG